MNFTSKTLPTASALSVLLLSALAEDTTSPASTEAQHAPGRRAHETRASHLRSAAKVSDVIGMNVENYQSEKLATVSDLALDLESGRIVQVILSTGGFLGIGDKLTAVRPGRSTTMCSTGSCTWMSPRTS